MRYWLKMSLSILLAISMMLTYQPMGKVLAGVAGPLLKPYEAIMYGGKYHIVLRQRGDRVRNMMNMTNQFYTGKEKEKRLAEAKKSFYETTYVTDGVNRCSKRTSHFIERGYVSDSYTVNIWKDGKHYTIGDNIYIPGFEIKYPSAKKKNDKLVGTVVSMEQESNGIPLLKDWYMVQEFMLILNEDMVQTWEFVGSGEKEIGGVLHQSETYDMKAQYNLGGHDNKHIFYFYNGRLAFVENDDGLKEVIAFDTEVAASEFVIPAGTTIYQGGQMGISSLTNTKPPVVEQY